MEEVKKISSEIHNTLYVRMRAVAPKAESGDFRLIFCITAMTSILTTITALLAQGAPSPLFSVSFTFLFPKLPTVGTAGFLQSRSFSVVSFVSLFINQHLPHHPRTLWISSEAVGSICPGGLSFIVIHPADYTLPAFHCMLREGFHCEKKIPFLKNEKSDLQVEERAKPPSFKGVSLLWLSWVMRRPHRAHVLDVLIVICWSVSVVEGIVERFKLSAYAMAREKTSYFLSTCPAVCHAHKYGGEASWRWKHRLGWAWGNSQRHLQKISVSNVAP